MLDDNDDRLISDDLISLTVTSCYYTVFLDEEVLDPDHYRSFFNLLRRVSSNDIIEIIINTGGGNASTAMQLINAIVSCPAYCIALVYSAHSAGAMIALACDEIKSTLFCSMMFHTTSWCNINGKVNEVGSLSKFVEKWDVEILKTLYKNFLTDKEIEKIISGGDVWLNEVNINKRLKKWIPFKKIINQRDLK